MIEGFAVGVMVGAFFALMGFTIPRKAIRNAVGRWFGWVILLVALPAFSQNCDKIVTDDAGMLNGKDQQVLVAADALINQGADVRVRTFTNSGGNLDLVENAIEKTCPSWQGVNGVRKSTLIVLAVSKDRKIGVYYGAAWHKALDDHWNRIKTDDMVPRFKSGQFAEGFVAAENQLGKRLAASKDEGLKPVTNQVVNQATDVSGLWPILWGTLSGVFLAICIVTFLTLSNRRKREKETLNVARMSAVVERDNAARALNSFADKIADKKAAGDAIPALAETYFNSASEDYGRVSALLKFDPSDKNLSLVEYNSITSTYRAINQKLKEAAIHLAGFETKTKSEPAPPGYPKSQPYVPPTAPAYTPPAPTQATYIPAPSSDVVIISNQQSTYVAPEPVYEEPVHHHRHEDENDASTSYSSSSDSGGGGSSSWSSSDSSSDSGGSSSYDSGGGDSGGGGSSDY